MGVLIRGRPSPDIYDEGVLSATVPRIDFVGAGVTVTDDPTNDGVTVTIPAGGGVTDHGALTGLADDDHPQYGALAQAETWSLLQTFSAGIKLAATQQILDSGGTGRILLATTTPHVTLTGDVRLSGIAGVNTPVSALRTLNVGMLNGGGSIYGIFVGGNSPTLNTGNHVIGIGGNVAITVAAASTATILDSMAFYSAVVGGSGATVGGVRGVVLYPVYGVSFTGTVTKAVGVAIEAPVLPGSASVWTTVIGVDIANQGHAQVSTAYGVRVQALSGATVAMQPFRDEGITAGDANGNRFRSNTQFGSLTGAFGGGAGVVGIANAPVIPGGTPAAGLVLYAEAGHLKAKLSTGVKARLNVVPVAFTAINDANGTINVGEAGLVYITGPTAAYNIAGISGGEDGRVVYLYSAVLFNLTILNEDAGTTAANRIQTNSGFNDNLITLGVYTLIYSATAARWIVTAKST